MWADSWSPVSTWRATNSASAAPGATSRPATSDSSCGELDAKRCKHSQSRNHTHILSVTCVCVVVCLCLCFVLFCSGVPEITGVCLGLVLALETHRPGPTTPGPAGELLPDDVKELTVDFFVSEPSQKWRCHTVLVAICFVNHLSTWYVCARAHGVHRICSHIW